MNKLRNLAKNSKKSWEKILVRVAMVSEFSNYSANNYWNDGEGCKMA